jgi:prepilin-type N-terminal cleavage/methylation domain-containing protein
MTKCRSQAGFSLLETLIALMLVGVAMTGLLVAFAASGQFGILGRRQATALAIARSVSGQLSKIAYSDPLLANNNALNDANIGDPNGLFAQATLPTSSDAPDSTMASRTVGNETYEVYVNVALQMGDGTWDPTTLEIGRVYAVIVRYQVGSTGTQNAMDAHYMRAVSVGYHYNPAAVGTGSLPLPL